MFLVMIRSDGFYHPPPTIPRGEFPAACIVAGGPPAAPLSSGAVGTERRAAVRGVEVFWQDRGQGPPVLFLHGNPDSGDLWDDVIDRLEGRFRCIAPDLPGFGRSRAPAGFDCTLEGMARFVDAFVRKAELPLPLDLVMHDFGGPYGLAWAVRHPEKIRRLLIIDSLFFADYRWHFWARIWRTPLLGELSMLAMNRRLFAWELRRGSNGGLSEEHIRRAYARDSPELRRMVLHLYRTTDPSSFRGWEEEMLALTARRPTRVLWGALDPYIPKRWAHRFGTEDVHVLPGCGHWPPAERPTEVAAQLLEFLGD